MNTLIIIYSMSMGIYGLTLATSAYYYFITKEKFPRNTIFFALFALLYTGMSLEACFYSKSAYKNIIDITFMSLFGITSSIFYTFNIDFFLSKTRNVTKNFRYVVYVLLVLVAVSIPIYLIFDFPLYLEISSKSYINPILKSGMQGIDFSFFGEFVLLVEIMANIMMISLLIFINFKSLLNEKLLFVGFVISLTLIVNDNLVGILSNKNLVPLMSLGFIPESLRFLKYILTRDYRKKIEYSNHLIETLKQSQKTRVLGQFVHDSSRLINKLNEDPILSSRELKELLNLKYNWLNERISEKEIDVYQTFNFTRELFDKELSRKNISIELPPKREYLIKFNLTDMFIIFSNLIQNTIDHSNADQIILAIKEGAVETQVLYRDNGTNLPVDFGQSVFANKALKPDGNLGQGLINARNSAIANSASLEYIGEGRVVSFRLRVFGFTE